MKKLMLITMLFLMCGSVFADHQENEDYYVARHCLILEESKSLARPRNIKIEIFKQDMMRSYAGVRWAKASRIRELPLPFVSTNEDSYTFSNGNTTAVLNNNMVDLKLTLDGIEYVGFCTRQTHNEYLF